MGALCQPIIRIPEKYPRNISHHGGDATVSFDFGPGLSFQTTIAFVCHAIGVDDEDTIQSPLSAVGKSK